MGECIGRSFAELKRTQQANAEADFPQALAASVDLPCGVCDESSDDDELLKRPTRRMARCSSSKACGCCEEAPEADAQDEALKQAAATSDWPSILTSTKVNREDGGRTALSKQAPNSREEAAARDGTNPKLSLSEFPPLQHTKQAKPRPTPSKGTVIDLDDDDDDDPPEMDVSDDEDERDTRPAKAPKGEPYEENDLDREFTEGKLNPNEFMDKAIRTWPAVRAMKDTRRQVMSAAVQSRPSQVLSLFTAVGELHSLPTAEPEFYEVECTLDTGATVHAADRLDFPGYTVTDSAGSLAGQNFQAAGGKLIANEGEMMVHMLAPGGEVGELHSCFQVAKVTRPLLSVTRMTASGELNVLCKKDEALVLNSKQQVVARFQRSGGLYTTMMKVKNPNFQPFPRPAR